MTRRSPRHRRAVPAVVLASLTLVLSACGADDAAAERLTDAAAGVVEGVELPSAEAVACQYVSYLDRGLPQDGTAADTAQELREFVEGVPSLYAPLEGEVAEAVDAVATAIDAEDADALEAAVADLRTACP